MQENYNCPQDSRTTHVRLKDKLQIKLQRNNTTEIPQGHMADITHWCPSETIS